MTALDVLDISGARDPHPQWPRLRTIEVARGVGVGPTPLSAFDAALRRAGVANHNLIYLSSVIPPDTAVVEVDRASDRSNGGWGDRLYVVMAEERTDRPGREVWAGIGWVQSEDDGRGLFVEHHANSESNVISDIERSLEAMVAGRPEEFGPVQMVLQGAVCDTEPVSALVTAVYESAPWSPDLRGD